MTNKISKCNLGTVAEMHKAAANYEFPATKQVKRKKVNLAFIPSKRYGHHVFHNTGHMHNHPGE